MDKKKLTAAYIKMVDRIETAKMYDGRGTYDLYECKKCGKLQVTTYRDKGVTPFCMVCKSCGDTMVHVRSYTCISPQTPYVQWVRPTLEQFMKLPQPVQQHVLQGGLILDTEIVKDVDDWYPLQGEPYYFPIFDNARGCFVPWQSIWCHDKIDGNRMARKMVFRTVEECQPMCDKMNKAVALALGITPSI